MKKVNLVTLGVKDLEKAKSYYGNLFGWATIPKPTEGVAFYDMGGWILSLFPTPELAKDAKLSAEGQGFRNCSFAHTVETKEAVAELLAEAEKLGGKIIKPAEDVFWGGRSGYFADPDGHLWEIAWNPGFPKKPDGTLDVAGIS